MDKKEAYLKYLDEFFKRWIKLYDFFALSIFNVYQSTVNMVSSNRSPKILDICTGTGEIAVRLARKNFQVTAIDITEVMINEAKRKTKKLGLNIDFRLMDARQLDFTDKSFETVIIGNALHDMPRKVRIQVLIEAKRVCKTDLIITDYHFPKLPLLFKVCLKVVSLFETPYFPSYVREGLDPLLVEAGLPLGKHKVLFPGLFSVVKINLAE